MSSTVAPTRVRSATGEDAPMRNSTVLLPVMLGAGEIEMKMKKEERGRTKSLKRTASSKSELFVRVKAVLRATVKYYPVDEFAG